MDLLSQNLGDDLHTLPTRKTPVMKDVEQIIEPDRDPMKVKEAQRVVGELVWLGTRCRPDIMYIVARLASGITRYPTMVAKMAQHVWLYLLGTVGHGLVFENVATEDTINVFSDASYGDICQGCTVVQWGSGPLLWKSTKQSIVASSTAEAELFEVMEAVTSGEAVRVVIEEIFNDEVKARAFTDSSSALAIAVGDSGSWRTRHLRKRASALRWRVARGDWVLRHLPGTDMTADIGTKALSSEKFEKCKLKLGVRECLQKEEEGLKKVEEGGGKLKHRVDPRTQKVLAAIVLLAEMRMTKAKEDEDQKDDQITWIDVAIFWFVLPMIIILVVMLLQQRWEQRIREDERRKVTAPEAAAMSKEKLEDEIRKVIQMVQVEEMIEKEEAEREREERLLEVEEGERIRRRNQAREGNPRTNDERPEEVGRREEGRRSLNSAARGSSSIPRLTFPNDAVGIYMSPHGAKYHFDRNCQGLQAASSIHLIPRCPNCGPVQSRPQGALFRNGGTLHTLSSHIVEPSDQHHRCEPCALCARYRA